MFALKKVDGAKSAIYRRGFLLPPHCPQLNILGRCRDK
jgi:hypothetical protein